MRRIRDSFARSLSFVPATFAALVLTPVAHAACNSGPEGYTNTCFGTNVLVSNETGGGNSGFGFAALEFNTTGTRNTATGFRALNQNTTGGANSASGSYALYSNTTGTNNTASGANALHSNTTGVDNTASGVGALYSNTAGNYNTASGHSTLYNNTTGNYNAASGYYALVGNTTGNYNTASGHWALASNRTGNYNVASGASALLKNTTGIYNTATGATALYSITSGQQNTASGAGALNNATTGYRNVALGYQAGLAVTTGSDNIIIGAGNSGLAASGVIRIGTSAYQKRAFIAGIRGVTTAVADAVPVLIDSKGQLGTIKSSRRFKEDIQPMSSVSERLFALRPVTFRYKQAYADGSKPVQYGLVAEEVAAVFPELVVYGKDGKPETVAYHVLATLLLNELQKDHQIIQSQADQLAELRRDNEAQVVRMAALEQQVVMLAQAVERTDKSQMVAATR